MTKLALFPAAVAAMIAAGNIASAQERSLNFALRGGVTVTPSYPGADSYEAGPDLGLTFGALRWGRINAGNGIGNAPDNGWLVSPAFRVIGDRSASDDAELVGLAGVDTAVELGFVLNFQQTQWRAFGEVRKGVTGHSGVTGTLGADMIFQPSDRLRITAGPRVSFGDGEFARTYFGVPTATANFAAFDADGGALGAGFEINAIYDLNDTWAIDGALAYERLIGDAGDSPIAAFGSEDQWSLRIGLRQEFTLRF